MPQPREEELAAQLREPLSETGLLIEEIKINVAGSRRKLTVVVDIADESSTAPVSLDDISRATSAVEAALDPDEVFAGKPYTLEITSPGAVRELSEPRHYRRSAGRRLALRTVQGEALVARLRGVDDEGVDLHDEKADELHRLRFEEIESARVDLEFK